MQCGNIMLLPNQEQDHSYIVGLDASITSFGVYCMPTSKQIPWFGWALQSTARDGNDTSRIIGLVAEICEHLDNLLCPISMAVFEDYGPINRTSGKVTLRAEMCGILKHRLLTHYRCPIIMVSPKSLKSFATGKGNADKETVMRAANMAGYYPDTTDEADAYFAARLGHAIAIGEKTGASFHRVNP